MKSLKTVMLVCAALALPISANSQQSESAVSSSDELQQSAAVGNSLLSLLQQMSQAWRSSNYETSFIQILPSQVNSYQYRHVFADRRHYAQLSALDGVQQEVVQRDNVISYYGGGYQPFSIRGSHILDNLPSAVYADYAKLQAYYDFIDAGKTRIADRIAQVVRVLPKDDFRYQYVLWIDEQSHLLLRSDILDRNSELLEQFRMIDLQQSGNSHALVSLLEQLNLPPLINIPGGNAIEQSQWRPAWIPPGFEVVKRENYETEIGTLESVMFSDGLFSFSLYINHNIADNLGEQYWQQAGNIIYTETRENREITLIGQIPLITAKRIVKDVSFERQAN
ncbi:MucB/RseB C-terminal domain-containing protein [Chelonobacter oris]|uniref:MucB/RseB C-terminal domain-containing protein n=1 Tax=Chelonobacter oris TaxID=505317 RepID=UPI00068F5232|nr:MucB/RseB C-terminal domain-containing protein [Chelonobacter oris]